MSSQLGSSKDLLLYQPKRLDQETWTKKIYTTNYGVHILNLYAVQTLLNKV